MLSKKGKATREYLETLSKEQVINLCLQFMFDAEISEQELDQANERLKKEIEERQHLQCDYKTYNNLKESAIVPKFKVGQKIWYIDRYGIQKDTIISFTYFSIQNEILYKMGDEIIDYREEYIFATEQEAQAKLKELRNE